MALVFTETANPDVNYVNYGSTSATFTDVSIGTATADRIVVVTAVIRATSAAFSGVTIGGSAATLAIKADGGDYATGIYYRTVTTGTTATVVVTCTPNAIELCGIQVGIITGATETPNDTDSKAWGYEDDPQALAAALTLATGGVGLVAIGSTGGRTPSWNSATQVYYKDSASGNTMSICTAKSTSAGSWSPSVSGYAYQGTTMAAATWEPAAGGPTPGSIVSTITL